MTVEEVQEEVVAEIQYKDIRYAYFRRRLDRDREVLENLESDLPCEDLEKAAEELYDRPYDLDRLSEKEETEDMDLLEENAGRLENEDERDGESFRPRLSEENREEVLEEALEGGGERRTFRSFFHLFFFFLEYSFSSHYPFDGFYVDSQVEKMCEWTHLFSSALEVEEAGAGATMK